MLFAAALPALATERGDELTPASRKLLAEYPGLQAYAAGARVYSFYGMPMTEGKDPLDAAERYLARHATAFGVGRPELTLEFSAESATGMFTFFGYRQSLDGIPVENGIVRLAVLHGTPDRVVYAAARLAAPPAHGFRPVETSAPAALASMKETESFRELPEWTAPQLVVFYEEADVNLEEPALAWKFLGSRPDPTDHEAYTFFVSAADGSLLYLRDEVYHVDVTGHVDGKATPGTLPDVPYNPPALRDLFRLRTAIVGGNSTYTDASGNYVIPYGGSGTVTVEADLIAPWVHVYHDQGAEIHLTQSVTPPGPANFTFNSSPSEFTTAQVNGFVITVRTHDFIKERVPGWTGLDMQITCNVNLASTCNAYYSSANQSINFYAAGGGCVNTAYTSVVSHEYGHFIVNRLGLLQGAFGEGYGDVIGMLMYDDPILGRDFYGVGTNVRDPVGENLQYPCSGEIHYCGMLIGGCWWDIRDQIGITEGSAPGLATTQQLFADWSMITIGGIDTNSAHPQTAIEVLTVDDVDGNIYNGTPHFNEICTAFGNHNIPCPELPEIIFTYPYGLPATLAPNTATPIRVNITGNTENPVGGTETFHYRVNGGTWTSAPLSVVNPGEFQGTLPAATCYDVYDFYFSVLSTSGSTITDPANAPTDSFHSTVATGLLTIFEDDFQSNLGWTVQNVNLTGGAWERGTPAGDGTRGDPLVDGDGSGACYLTQNAAGNTDVDGGPTILTSPNLDFSVADGTISYWYWMYNDDGDDSLVVEVSGNGGSTWTTVTSYLGGNGGWYQDSFTVGDYVTPTNQVRVRFSVADNPNDSVTEAAIDGVKAQAYECSGIIDCNENGIPDGEDIANGTSQDCNLNGIPDECDIEDGVSQDCNLNGIPDECDIDTGTSLDCNANGVPDECDIAGGASQDCNLNGVPDECDIAGGLSEDCNGNGVPDECDLLDGTSEDCNSNGIPDECDIASGTSEDANGNGIPDECDPAIVFCGVGAVNTGCGPTPVDVLFVNGSTGGADRTLQATPTTPLSFVINEAPNMQGDTHTTKTLIYLWLAAPTESDIVVLPKNFGPMCFGPLYIATFPPTYIWNSIGAVNKAGVHNAPSPPPIIPDGQSLEFYSLPGGFGQTATFTVQGILQDICTQATKKFSVTNGLVVEVQ